MENLPKIHQAQVIEISFNETSSITWLTAY